MINEILKKRIEEWTNPPFDSETIKEIESLLLLKDEKELNDRFYTTLEFGTGGLRGILGAGTNRMNIYTVGMATQGLANYIINKGCQDKGVVIACDSRKMSDIFSKEAASILAANGIRVYIFDEITPTPLCSFAIRELSAVSGIVITASHNPPEYNGFKAYWDDGGQVIPPFDAEIIEEVKRIDSISKIQKIDYKAGLESEIIRIIGDEIRMSYTDKLEKAAFRTRGKSDIKIVYTPLHGTGYKILPDTLSYFGFTNLSLVKEQSKPDGNFPTVIYPNPEEKEALLLSLDLAQKIDADIIMATDPDADRMGIGFKDKDGNYQLINGNQIGTMLEYYILTRLQEENRLPLNGVIIKTIVTTDLQEDIAKSFNCHIENVLTGFKWIAMKMKEYDDSGDFRFIFGGEESYGYLPVDFVRDKDAISACYFFAEMTDWLYERGNTLNDFLNEIYSKYMLYLEDLHSLTLKGIEGIEQIKSIMKGFRNNHPKEFAGINVLKIADIQELKLIDIQNGKEESIEGLPKSNVLQFFLTDGSKLTMRPSGTEPKIKFYFSVCETIKPEDAEKVKLQLKKRITILKDDLLKKIQVNN
ncbi:MAG: phospho-sugar mutase [Spirochaetota bacterium]|nr:phospho-sugar mutase [Spirochaetota bacterium]